MPNFEKQENNKIEVLDPAPEDARDIIAVQKETWLATYPNEEYGITTEDVESINWDDPKRLERWEKNIAQNGGKNRIWVAKEEGKVVGFCTAIKEEGNRLATIYVLPEYQNKGIGKRLVREALDWLGSEKDVAVSIAKFNRKAIDFYAKTGFQDPKEAPPDSSWHFPSGKVMPEVEMTKPRRDDANND